MEFKAIWEAARDDALVKVVFDHIRNLGLVALICSIAAWKFHQSGIENIICGVIFGAFGFVVFWLNFNNGIHKLRKINAPLWIKCAFGAIYTVFCREIVNYLINK